MTGYAGDRSSGMNEGLQYSHMPSRSLNPKRSKRLPKRLIIGGGKLAAPSAPLSLLACEFLEEQFGREAYKTPALLQELGWIDKQGNIVGDHSTNELLGMEFDPAYVRPLKLLDRLGPRAIQFGLRRVEGDIPGYPFDHVAYGGTPEQLREALSEAGINTEVRAHLFTRSEHLVLSSWLEVRPDEARESLGRQNPPCWEITRVAQKMAGSTGNRCVDAAVATILLRSIEHRLPNWAAWSPETGVLLARNSHPRTDSRKLHLMPQHLFTINWASSGPGFSWPNQYNLCWVPLYERYVVTVSADSPEGLAGYTDLALGSFGAAEDIEDSVCAIVVGDWNEQLLEWQQQQWEYVLEPGLISTEALTEWAGEVWGEESKDGESD
jgi:hypothetical protein